MMPLVSLSHPSWLLSCRLSFISINCYLLSRVCLLFSLDLLLNFLQLFSLINNFLLMNFNFLPELCFLLNIKLFQVLGTILPYAIEYCSSQTINGVYFPWVVCVIYQDEHLSFLKFGSIDEIKTISILKMILILFIPMNFYLFVFFRKL